MKKLVPQITTAIVIIVALLAVVGFRGGFSHPRQSTPIAVPMPTPTTTFAPATVETVDGGKKVIHFGIGVQSFAWANTFTGTYFGSAASFKSGHLYGLHCILTAAGSTTPVYAMCFDSFSAGPPSGGATPLGGCVSSGLSTVGNDVVYSDQDYAQYQYGPSIAFTNGLLIALSTTTTTFTGATTATARCDALVGP